MLKDFRIGSRLALGFGIVLVLNIAAGLFAWYNMDNLANLTTRMYDHPLTISNAVRDIRANIYAMHRSMKDVPLAQTQKQADLAIERVNEYEAQTYASFKVVFERFLGDIGDVAQAHQSFAAWKVIRDEIIELNRTGKKEEAAAITRGKGAQHVERMNAEIQQMIDFASLKADSFLQDAQIQRDKALYFLAIFNVIIILIGGVIALVISRGFVTPLSSIVDRIHNLSIGNTQKTIGIESRDEIGDLARSYRELQTDLQNKVSAAEFIAAGDLSKDIFPRSDEDELGAAFYGMTTSLRRATEENERHSQTMQESNLQLQKAKEQAEEVNLELSRREQRFRSLLESTPDCMIIVDDSGKVVLANTMAETVLGYTPEELIGQPISLLLPDQLRDGHEEHRLNYMRDPQVRQMGGETDLLARRKDGTEFPADIRLSPIEVEDGLNANRRKKNSARPEM